MVDLILYWIRTSTTAWVKDARLVMIHARHIGVESSANRSLVKNLLQTIVSNIKFFVCTFVVEAGHIISKFNTLSWSSCLVFFWIWWPIYDSVVNRPRVSVGHPTTITAVVSVITFHKILNWKSWHWLTLVVDCKKRLHRCSSRKSPAWPTTTLIYTWTYLSFSSPINFWGQICDIDRIIVWSK